MPIPAQRTRGPAGQLEAAIYRPSRAGFKCERSIDRRLIRIALAHNLVVSRWQVRNRKADPGIGVSPRSLAVRFPSRGHTNAWDWIAILIFNDALNRDSPSGDHIVLYRYATLERSISRRARLSLALCVQVQCDVVGGLIFTVRTKRAQRQI